MAAWVFLDFHKNSTARNGVKKEDRKLFTTVKWSMNLLRYVIIKNEPYVFIKYMQE